MKSFFAVLFFLIGTTTSAAESGSRGESPVQPGKGTFPGFIDFTARGTQPELAHPLADAGSCRGCHSGGSDETHMPYPGWAGSMMANATRDPLFWAALDVANQDGLENGAEGIGDYCLRCHAPEAWYGGRVRKRRDVPDDLPVDAQDVIDGSDGCKLQGRPDFEDIGNDYSGVTCHLCHRIAETGPMAQWSFLENADLWLDDGDCDGQGEPCRAGPYGYPFDYVDPEFGSIEYPGPPHPWKRSSFHGDSALCGSCHDVSSPVLAGGPFRSLIIPDGTTQGEDTGLAFPAERTYSEWRQSEFARLVFRDGIEGESDLRRRNGETCQGCHMPQAKPPVDDPDRRLYASSIGSPPRNGQLPTHEFAGANAWIPGILKGEFPGLGRAGAFDRTTAAARRMLTEESARMTSQSRLLPDGEVEVTVRVENLSGHKLPTGYGEGRRMWIQVEVRDANDQIVWSNGRFDPASGALEADAQTKIYEVKQGTWDATTGECRTRDAKGRAVFHFVLNDCIAKDNRIPPAGFLGGNDPQTAAYAYSYAQTRGISEHADTTRYALAPGPDVEFPLSVTTRLLYQTASREYVEFLRDQAQEKAFASEDALCSGEPGRPFPVGARHRSRGQYVYELWESPIYGRSPPVVMQTAITTVQRATPAKGRYAPGTRGRVARDSNPTSRRSGRGR